jgi:hypothetical protein
VFAGGALPSRLVLRLVDHLLGGVRIGQLASTMHLEVRFKSNGGGLNRMGAWPALARVADAGGLRDAERRP